MCMHLGVSAPSSHTHTQREREREREGERERERERDAHTRTDRQKQTQTHAYTDLVVWTPYSLAGPRLRLLARRPWTSKRPAGFGEEGNNSNSVW